VRWIAFFLAAGCAFAQAPMHLTLAEAQRQAVQNHPRIAAARYSAAAAAETPKQYHAAYEPLAFASLTGVGADNGSRLAAGGLNNPIVYNRLGSGMTVSQMITDFGRTSNLVASAKLRAEAETQAVETTREGILLDVSQAYFGLLRSSAVLKVAEETVASRKLVADQVSALAESKMKSTLDVSFANVNLAQAQLLLSQAQSDVKAATAQLATSMGLPNETAFDLTPEPMPDSLPDRADDLIHTALASRPELKDLRLRSTIRAWVCPAPPGLCRPVMKRCHPNTARSA
jgi:outer membrane protein